MGASVDPNEELREHIISDEHYRTIEITSKVMREIEVLQHNKKSVFRSFKRKTVMSIIVSCILLVSFTAYAATGQIQIFNNKGKVVLNTIDMPTTTFPEKLSDLLEEYRARVLADLKPGELAAYYIKDDYINKLNGYDTANPIKYEDSPIDYRSNEAFLTEQARTSAPLLKEPEYLPKGLSFSYGEVFPERPHGASTSYENLKQGLIAKANSSNSDEKLFIEKLDWSNASTSTLYLAHGKNSRAIVIQASYAIKQSLTQSQNDVPEKIQLKHIEAIYLNKEDGGDWIAWYDSKLSIAYFIWVNDKGLISKKELQKMAESMITD